MHVTTLALQATMLVLKLQYIRTNGAEAAGNIEEHLLEENEWQCMWTGWLGESMLPAKHDVPSFNGWQAQGQ